MKIYKRQDFLKLLPGIFYCKGTPFAFEGLCIKQETCLRDDGSPFDWRYFDVSLIESQSDWDLDNKQEEMLEKGVTYPLAENSFRDGCFDEKDIFLVYEKEDLKLIREYIDNIVGDNNEPTD